MEARTVRRQVGARGPGAGEGAAPSKGKVRFSSAWREARQLMWARRGRLALGLGLMVVSRIAGLVLPATPKFLIDNVVGGRPVELPPPLDGLAAPLSRMSPSELLTALGLAVVAATLVQAATSFALSQVLSIAAQRSIAEMRRTVQAHVARLPVRFFDSTKSGVLISRIMTDAEGVRNLVGTGLVQLVGGFITAAFALAVLLWLNWRLTLVTLGVLLAFGGVMAFAFRRLRPIFRERGKLNAEVTGRLSEALGGIRIVKVYTAEKREEMVFSRGVHRLLRNVAATITGISAVGAFASVVIGAVGVVMLIVGGRSILAGTMTLGDLVTYISFTLLLASPVMQIASIGTQITEAFAGLDRIRELMREPTEEEGREVTGRLARLSGDVAFEGVTFGYEEGVPVLRDVSFHAEAGTTTALVGSSGSGKSTLIGLIAAFNQPWEGRILVDGRDLATVGLRDYRSRLGVVTQDNFLFDGTIAENIAYGRPGASREEVEAAARIAHCDEFVAGFEQGYDTVIGERGVKLSGGQRQRVAIARAILADPDLLILDEATSSLDSESEQLIQEALGRLRQGRTTFVIAHRLSTIRAADQILVIEAGEIVERGTHAELHALGGRYRELHDKQHRLETDRYVNPGEELACEDAPVAERQAG
ncbi:MAG TPA: ABC transporter ATP-binding protein [Thermoanaerobaculia bacterium]|nr:ABC transporter ATP-binding protein [Thermoanaerobaculia bacterium]